MSHTFKRCLCYLDKVQTESKNRENYTFKDPLKNEIRLRHTGMSINIQLRFRQAALARAQGRASCKERQIFIAPVFHVGPTCVYFTSITFIKLWKMNINFSLCQ